MVINNESTSGSYISITSFSEEVEVKSHRRLEACLQKPEFSQIGFPLL